MTQPIHIYALGNAMVDTEIEVTDQDLQQFNVDKGMMTLVDEERQKELIQLLEGHLLAAKRASGGSACNSLYAAANFGANTFYSCLVADDENGEFFLNDLSQAGVGYLPSFVKEGEITGKCLVMVTPDAERTMNTFLGVGAGVSKDQLHPEAIEATQWAYLEGYLVSSDVSREATITLRDQIKSHGGKVAMTFSDPAMVKFFSDGLLEMLGDGVDLLFCNEEEAITFTEAKDVEEAVEKMKAYANTFAITCGGDGALVFDGNELIKIAPHSITPVDSNGAGDMFAGAFLYAVSQGYSYQQAGDLASLAAAKVVSQYGPRLKPEQHLAVKTAVIKG